MSPAQRRVLIALKSLLAIALLVAVGWQFAKLLRSPNLSTAPPTLRWHYLALSGLLYGITHTIWATFFVLLLKSQDNRVPWLMGVRAYFISQFGKYIPGKAWVIVVRVLMLRPQGLGMAVVGVMATYETLTSMAAGALLGVCLLPWAGLGLETGSWKWLALLAIVILPLCLGLINRLFAKLSGKYRAMTDGRIPDVPMKLLALGLLLDSVGWCVLGLSMFMAIQGVVPTPVELTRDAYLSALAAVALSYVAGFVIVIAPGGLGARELLVQQMVGSFLQPLFQAAAEPLAAVVSLMLRLAWTVAEVIIGGLLFVMVRNGPVASVEPVPRESHV